MLGLFLPIAAALLALPAALPTLYVQRMADALAALPFAALSTQSVYLKLWLALVYHPAFLSARAGEKLRLFGPGDSRAVRPGAQCVRRAAHRLGAGRGTGYIRWPCSRRGRAACVDSRRHRGGQPGGTAADYFQSLGLNAGLIGGALTLPRGSLAGGARSCWSGKSSCWLQHPRRGEEVLRREIWRWRRKK
ncbi:MAG: hypothetical protein ACLRWQ_01770 [Flavonifractor plautii]